MIEQNKIPEGKHLRRLFWVLWVTYFSINLGRLNFSAALSQMVADGFTKGGLGAVAAAFFASYAAAQLLAGRMGDKAPARLLVFLGLAGSGIVNLLFPLAQSVGVMLVLWLVNGMAQAFIWPPMARLIADRTTGNQYRRCVLLLSTTGPAGMLCAYGLSAALIYLGGWRACFC